MLRTYQEEAAHLLAVSDRMILGDPIGVGKTRTVLRAAQLRGAGRVSVVCPAIVRDHWRDEARAIGTEFRLGVTTYGVLSTNDRVLLGPGLDRPDVLIVDEFHYCKKRESKRTKLVFGSGGLAEQMLQGGGAVWPVSGTPMPRNPSELFPALWALYHEELISRYHIGGWMAWLKRFCAYRVGPHGVRVYGARNVTELREILAARMIRRTSLPLPPLRFGVVKLSAEDLSTLPELSPEIRTTLAAGRLPPADENLARYRHAVGDLKAPLVGEMVFNELDGTEEKVVVLAYHRSVLQTLRNKLQNLNVAYIDGDTPDVSRRRAIEEFRTYPNVRVFLGQIDACATGLDGLQYAAREVVVVEPSWDSDKNVQAIGRLRRSGQMGPVNARFIALNDSVDEAIVRQYERECAMRSQVTP